MAEKQCTGNCLQCSMQQQVYCAAQYGHAVMAFMPVLMERLDGLTRALSGFSPQEIINPLKDNAQKGSGADNREPSTS